MTALFNVDWVSSDRYARYLVAADGDEARAISLYVWNARVAAALFEVIHHFEVLLRNAITSQLQQDGTGSLPPGTPWIQNHKQVLEVEGRLKKIHKKPTPGRIYSGLSFGFWSTLFGTDYEELWRHCLRFVFKNSHADRSTIAAYLESLNLLRNRIAHHGCLLEVDVTVECQKIIRLSSWIDPRAGEWIKSFETVTSIARELPVPVRKNVLIVGSADSWELISKRGKDCYFIGAAMSIQPVEYIGFYADREIKPYLHKVVKHIDAVDWSPANAKRLSKSEDQVDKSIGGIISASISLGRRPGAVNQVFLLSSRTSDDTITLGGPIPHSQTGRGSAFVKLHRYLPLSSLKSARSTKDM